MSYKTVNPQELRGNVFEWIDNRWFLVTAKKYKSDNKINTMTASWGFMGIMWGKPVMNCVIRPVRYTYEFMEEADYYTFSFFPEEYRKALNLLGTKSGRSMDKITESGLNLIDVGEIYDAGEIAGKAVSFKEADIIMTCKKLYYQDINPENFIDVSIDKTNYPKKDYHRVYWGEIVNCSVRE